MVYYQGKYVGFVSNEAYNGHNELNPFNFKNYSLRHIACYLDGTQYPQRPYTPDFTNKKYIREYFGLLKQLIKSNIILISTLQEKSIIADLLYLVSTLVLIYQTVA